LFASFASGANAFTLNASDFQHATVVIQDGHTVVKLSLSNPGVNQLRDYSANHVGEKLAISVDNKVIAAPEIREPLQDGAFEITGLTQSQATQLAHSINHDQVN
jgi:preprotein translocase subunit SecD